MDLRIFVEPQQGATYDDQLTVAQAAERLGFGGFFRSDHFLKMGSVSGHPGPTDSWVTLGAVARETTTIRLGTLVSAATFRLPGPLAVAVAQVDEMSNGRIELGLGTGWFDDEHTAYGIPFPSVAHRFEMLEEQLRIITGLWHTPPGGSFSFEGNHYTLVGSPALPAPVQRGGPPIIIGGHGTTRTPALAAQFAREFNVAFPTLNTFRAQRDRVMAACEATDRDPDSMIFSVALVVACGRHEEELRRRAANIDRRPDELRINGAAGTPAEVLDTLADFAEAGAHRAYLQVLDLHDLDHLELIGEEVLAILR